MKTYKVKFINGSSMRVKAKSENNADGLCRQYGLISSIKPACSRLWLLIFPALLVLGYFGFVVGVK